MKFKIIILTGFLFLLLNGAEAQQLEKRVSFVLEDKSIEEVLEYLHINYKIDFSYINNELPQDLHSMKYNDIMLKDVLNELLKDTELGFVEYEGQVIIQRGIKKPTKPLVPANDTSKKEPKKDVDQEQAQVQQIREAENFDENSSGELSASVDTIDISVPLEKEKIVDNGYPALPPDLSEQFRNNQLLYFFERNYEPSEYIKQPYHFGVFYPLSTNGIEAGKYVNQLSLHLFVGFSAGLEGFETSFLGNVEKDYVQGFQLGGLFNVVQNNVTGGQVAGLTNIVGGETNGLQVSGITNIAREGSDGAQIAGVANLVGEDSDGLQASGVANIVDGNYKGFQATGVANIVNGDVDGFQVAGVVNVANGYVKSGQVSGFVNIADETQGLQVAGFGNFQNGKGNSFQAAGFINEAKDINGIQVAGFINTARNIKGLQAAGFINIARSMKGVQLGVINIADSLQGLPIGLLSIVHKNGYYDLEFFYGDDFDANTVLKVGAPKFHNIFGFSYEKLAYEKGETNRWALGYGFGAQFGKKTFRLNTDLIGYHVFERNIDDTPFTEYDLNFLGKLRTLASIHMGNFGMFAGPVFNIMVSRHQDPESGQIGSGLITETYYNKTFNDRTNVKLWMGYNIGIRF